MVEKGGRTYAGGVSTIALVTVDALANDLAVDVSRLQLVNAP
jgi:hypothetical protein